MITLRRLAKPSIALVFLGLAMTGYVGPAVAQSCPFESLFSSSSDASKATAEVKAKPRSTATKGTKKRTLAKSKQPPAKIIPANTNGGSGAGGGGGWG